MRLFHPFTSRRSALIAGATALMLTATWSGLAAADADDNDKPPRSGLSIGQVQDRVAASGYRDIDRIKWDDDGYSVRARHADGSRARLRVDPRTGEVVERRRHDDRHDRTEERAWVGDARGAAECSKRRCRDDMPQADAGAALQSPPAKPPAGR
jgi:hypothetical protein